MSKQNVISGIPQSYGGVVWNGSAWESDLVGYVDVCAEFGVTASAAGSTSVDNSTALNTALSTLGAAGLKGYLKFPGAGNVYTIKNPLIIGNGSTSAFSTWSSVLEGGGMPGGPNVTATGLGTVQTMIQWGGAAGAGPMVQVLGPVVGWGLKNLAIDGGAVVANAPSFALSMVSAVRGECPNLAVSNCQSGIQFTTIASRSGALAAVTADCIYNRFTNTSVNYIGKSGATSYGVIFMCGASSASNSCFNSFDGLWFSPPGTSYGSTVNANMYFKGCDSNYLRNVTNDNPAGTDTHWLTYWDYTFSNIWPAGNIIEKIDGAAQSSGTTGTCSTAGTIGANSVQGISAVNGQQSNQQIQNVRWYNNTYNGLVQLVAGTATITAVKTAQAGSVIKLWNIDAIGTAIGVPTIGTRTTGSFVMYSQQPGAAAGTVETGDTSYYYYEVINDAKY